MFEAFSAALYQALHEAHCTCPIFVLMPEHAHIMILGTLVESDTKRAMDRFKFKMGWWLYRNIPNCRWQTDYFDHILRGNDPLRTQVLYIVNNPVRRGLVQEPFEWPFLGSFDHDIRQIIAEAQ